MTSTPGARFSALLTAGVLIGIATALLRWHGGWPDWTYPGNARVLGAVGVLSLYFGLCVAAWRMHRPPDDIDEFDSHDATSILVVYASQTGSAERLARQTLGSLRRAGVSATLRSLAHLDADLLVQARRALFVVSTTGEGDAPDSAAAFVQDVLARSMPLPSLRYAVLALGDRDYDQFCAFGHRLDDWLRRNGARPLFDLVEVDNEDAGALRHWQHALGVAIGHTEMPDWQAPAYQSWRLVERRHLNPGSVGGACFHLVLQPPSGVDVAWRAGDIAEIGPRRPSAVHDGMPLPHREYSIASMAADGAIHLLVRRFENVDGQLGLGSGWLTTYAPLGGAIDLRIRGNSNFHGPDDDRPLILIGNGTGMAGLRALLKERIAAGRHRNWLLFGERQAAHDFHYRDEIEAWRARGHIARLDLAFSRDQAQRVYVQDALREASDALRKWVADGAAIYVCGSLEGMAPGVHAVLVEVLGPTAVTQLQTSGRYRRDVY